MKKEEGKCEKCNQVFFFFVPIFHGDMSDHVCGNGSDLFRRSGEPVHLQDSHGVGRAGSAFVHGVYVPGIRSSCHPQGYPHPDAGD